MAGPVVSAPKLTSRSIDIQLQLAVSAPKVQTAYRFPTAELAELVVLSEAMVTSQ